MAAAAVAHPRCTYDETKGIYALLPLLSRIEIIKIDVEWKNNCCSWLNIVYSAVGDAAISLLNPALRCVHRQFDILEILVANERS